VSLPMRARSVTAAKAAWCSQLHCDGEVAEEEEEEDWRAWRWSRRRSGDIGVEEQRRLRRGMVLAFLFLWQIPRHTILHRSLIGPFVLAYCNPRAHVTLIQFVIFSWGQFIS
jgi:hypothetical protein